MKIKNKKDFGLGVFSVLFSALILWLTMQLRASGYAGDPGPKMFPLIGAALMCVCGIGLIIKQDPAGGAFMTKRQWLAAGKVFLMYVLMVVLLLLFGFVVTTPIMMFLLTFMLSKLSMADATVKKRLTTSLIYGVISGVVICVIYVVALQAVLPEGIILEALGIV